MVQSSLKERLRRVEYVLGWSTPAIGVFAGLWIATGPKIAVIGGAIAEACAFLWWWLSHSEERLLLRVFTMLDECSTGLIVAELAWQSKTAGVARSQEVADAARDDYRRTGGAILQSLCDGLAELDSPRSMAEPLKAVIESAESYRLEYERLCADPDTDLSVTSVKSARARVSELVERSDEAIALLWESAYTRTS